MRSRVFPMPTARDLAVLSCGLARRRPCLPDFVGLPDSTEHPKVNSVLFTVPSAARPRLVSAGDNRTPCSRVEFCCNEPETRCHCPRNRSEAALAIVPSPKRRRIPVTPRWRSQVVIEQISRVGASSWPERRGSAGPNCGSRRRPAIIPNAITCGTPACLRAPGEQRRTQPGFLGEVRPGRPRALQRLKRGRPHQPLSQKLRSPVQMEGNDE